MSSERRQKPGSGGGKKSSLVDWIVIAIVVGLLGFAYLQYGENSKPAKELVGSEAPSFNLRAESGEVKGVPSLTGKVVLLDFWATWCRPCRKQMPALEELENDDSLGMLEVLSINTDDPGGSRKEDVRAYLKRNHLDFDVLYDNGAVSNLYRVTHIPTLVVIRPDGIIYYADSGVHSAERLRRLIREADNAGDG